MKKTQRHRPFWLGLLAFLLVVLLAGGFALAQLWGWLAAYQAATPQQAIINCIRQVQQGQPLQLHHSLQPASRFVSGEQKQRAIRALLGELSPHYDALRFLQEGGGDDTAGYTVVDESGRTVRFSLERKADGTGWQAWPLLELSRTLMVQAPDAVQVLVNGLALSQQELVGSVPAPGFEAMGEKAPHMNRYELTGLYELPLVEASSPMGECDLRWQGEEAVQATMQPRPELAAQLEALFAQMARQYALFVSDDLAFGQLSLLLVPDADFYRNLKTFDARWYVSHDSTEFEGLEVSELHTYGSDGASATVQFTYLVKKAGLRPRSYPSHYRMHAVQTDAGWKLLNLQVL